MFLYYIYIYTVYVCGLLSRVWLFATPWTIASQTPLTMGFPRQEYWSGLPFSSSSSCRKGDPFQAQEWALVSHSEMSCPRRHMCWESRRLCWERAPGWRAGGSGSPGGQLCHGVAVSGFVLVGLVSGLPLADHSDSESFLVVHASLSQDGRRGFWEVVGHVGSPCDLSRTLPVSGGLLVPCSLPGPPVIEQLMQMVTMVPDQGGWFQSVCFP